jgi:hypothetical protein
MKWHDAKNLKKIAKIFLDFQSLISLLIKLKLKTGQDVQIGEKSFTLKN